MAFHLRKSGVSALEAVGLVIGLGHSTGFGCKPQNVGLGVEGLQPFLMPQSVS